MPDIGAVVVAVSSWRAPRSRCTSRESLRPQRASVAASGVGRGAAYLVDMKRPLTEPGLALSMRALSDDELLRSLVELTRQARRVEADLVAHLAEVDERRLYARLAHSSLFAYCTEALHLSEAEAYLRIAGARASREHPALLEMLRDGRLHLTAIALLAPHLTAANRESVLARAVHRSRRQIEELVVELSPRPEAPAQIRRLPERRPIVARLAPPLLGGEPVPASQLRSDGVAGATIRLGGSAVTPLPGPVPQSGLAPIAAARPASIEPVAPARYRVQFTATAVLRDKLERLSALMRHSVPGGDLAAVIETAVTEKLERIEARRFGRRRAPRDSSPKARQCSPGPPNPESVGPHGPGPGSPDPGSPDPVGPASREAGSSRLARPTTLSRHIPVVVRRAVFERDGGRCRYTDENGRRCSAREGLEFHHRHPFGHGGGHQVDNLSLLCRRHNRYVAEHDYGQAAIDSCRGRARGRARADADSTGSRTDGP